MTVDIEKMKALAPAARVEACIAEAMEKYAGGSPGRDLTYYQNVHQDLAPLARQLERENDELRAEVERLRADPLYSTRRDADRWRFRKQFLASGGAIMFTASGCQLRRTGELVASGITEEEAIDAATRCRAEGGDTFNECTSKSVVFKESSNLNINEGTAPAAGTEKDAERWRMFMEAVKESSGASDAEWLTRIMDSACEMHGKGKEAIFAAIGAHTKAGKAAELKPCECGPEQRARCDYCAGYGKTSRDAAAETMDHAQLQALGQHQEKP